MNPSSISASEATALSISELATIERRARRVWVSVVVGLLGMQVAIGIAAVVLAVGDPSVAIVPNYHQKALDWDTTQRARQLTHKLGWTISPLVGDVFPESQTRLVRIEVRDRVGNPVSGLNLSAKLYHHARGAVIYDLPMVETDSGFYEARTRLVAAGMWQLQLQLEGDHGIASESRELIVD